MERFIRLLSDHKINRNIADIVVRSICKTEEEHWNRGSFYERLHDIVERIAVVAMIRILQTMYQNDCIHIIQNNADNKDMVMLFVSLYSMFDFIADQPISDAMDHIITQRPNNVYVNRQYSAKFPFSNVISEYCNALKSQIQGDAMPAEEEKKEQEDNNQAKGIQMDVDDEKNELLDRETPEISAQTIRMNAQNLKQQIQSVIAPLVDYVGIAMLELYAQDLIQLNAAKLQMDIESVSSEFIQLSAKYLMLITSVVHGNETEECAYHHNISIAALHVTMWNSTPLLLHLIKATYLLDKHSIHELNDMEQWGEDTLVGTILGLFQFIADYQDDNVLEKYNLYSISECMDFIVCRLEQMQLDLRTLYGPRNIVKIKMIALSNGLLLDVSDEVALYNVLDGVNDSQMFDYKIL
eukprot:935258_1